MVIIDDGVSAFDSSTHTVHTSIVRPNKAIWPFMQAFKSWRQGGPLDIHLSPSVLPFCWNAFLQSYFVSNEAVREKWNACRTLACESRRLYAEIETELGSIKLGESGRAHLSSPLVSSDREVVLSLKEKLDCVGVNSELLDDANQIQSYVGNLTVRSPDVMVKYPEDFVLDLHKYKSKIFKTVAEHDGICVDDKAVALDIGANGRVNAVLTNRGNRIRCDSVLFAGGWRAAELLQQSFGLGLNGDLTVAAGVRFKLPTQMVKRSVVCGPMFLAPGTDENGTECTDVGQMFLINFKDSATSRKHVSQAVERFHTYFEYGEDIGRIWNCVGRPITPSGLPFVEQVSQNMVVALGAGMFGASIGPALAKRSLDLLCEGIQHPYHSVFQRQNLWDIVHSYVQSHLPTKSIASGDQIGADCVEPGAENKSKPPLIQVGKRGSMTKALTDHLSESFQLSVFGASRVEKILEAIHRNPESVILVASHGSRANLPRHYDDNYVRAEDLIERVILDHRSSKITGIVVISGGLDSDRMQYVMTQASQRGIRFVLLPSLATSMEALVNATRGLLRNIRKPRAIVVEDTFHEGKKEVPSSGSIQILKECGEIMGWQRIQLVATHEMAATELPRRYPLSKVVLEKDQDLHENYCYGYSNVIPIIVKSQRLPVDYIYSHRVSLRGDDMHITLEQRVTKRDTLIPPLKDVLNSLSNLPKGFVGTGISSVIPFDNLDIDAGSLTQVTSIILKSLAKSKSITKIYLPKDHYFDDLLGSDFFDLIPNASVYRLSNIPYLEMHAIVDTQILQIRIRRDDWQTGAFLAGVGDQPQLDFLL